MITHVHPVVRVMNIKQILGGASQKTVILVRQVTWARIVMNVIVNIQKQLMEKHALKKLIIARPITLTEHAKTVKIQNQMPAKPNV